MDARFEYRPLPVHEPFHRSTAPERILFGAFGSGKSYGVISEAIAWCLEQPGIVGALTRKTGNQLRDAEEPIVKELIPDALWDQCTTRKMAGRLERLIFPNGSHLLFRSVDEPAKWRSLNLGFIAVDELNELSEPDFMEIYSRIRQRDISAEARKLGYSGKITRRGFWGATNPEGEDWIWRLWHPESTEQRKNSECFTSTTLDNPYLPPDYVEGLLTMPRQYIQRYVLCRFDDFAGRIYDQWGEQHFIKPPSFAGWTPAELGGRTFWMAMDPGTQSPTAVLWVWVDRERNRLVGMAEYEEAGITAELHARAWGVIESQHSMAVRWAVADPNAITQRDRGTMLSLQSQYQRLGYNFTLGASKEHDRIYALGHLIHTGRFVVTHNCPRTYEAIKNYQWKDLTPAQKARGEDAPGKPLKKNTHLVECAQYLAGREVVKPKTPGPQRPRTRDERHRELIRRQIARRGAPGLDRNLGIPLL